MGGEGAVKVWLVQEQGRIAPGIVPGHRSPRQRRGAKIGKLLVGLIAAKNQTRVRGRSNEIRRIAQRNGRHDRAMPRRIIGIGIEALPIVHNQNIRTCKFRIARNVLPV